MTDRDDVHASGMEYSPTSATGTAWERTAVACDAAGGVGGADANQHCFIGAGVFVALQLSATLVGTIVLLAFL
jgi:hypothetical protein